MSFSQLLKETKWFEITVFNIFFFPKNYFLKGNHTWPTLFLKSCWKCWLCSFIKPTIWQYSLINYLGLGHQKCYIWSIFLFFFLQFLICTDVAARGLDVKGQLISKDIFFSINSSKKRTYKFAQNWSWSKVRANLFSFIFEKSETIAHGKYFLKLTNL